MKLRIERSGASTLPRRTFLIIGKRVFIGDLLSLASSIFFLRCGVFKTGKSKLEKKDGKEF